MNYLDSAIGFLIRLLVFEGVKRVLYTYKWEISDRIEFVEKTRHLKEIYRTQTNKCKRSVEMIFLVKLFAKAP